MYLLKEDLRATLVDIGNLLGGRDHTTIMHGVSKIQQLNESDPLIKDTLIQIREQLASVE